MVVVVGAMMYMIEQTRFHDYESGQKMHMNMHLLALVRNGVGVGWLVGCINELHDCYHRCVIFDSVVLGS